VRYKILYTDRAVRDLAKLNPITKERIGKSLEKCAGAPLNYAKKMVDPELGTYRFRIGDYRVIFDIEGDELIILRIGHRREIYRG
jgi:mRNA interferase RelE/StbE